MDMTVMTFNLRYITPNDGDNYWPNRIRRAAAIIKEHSPLVIGTQEGYHSMLLDLEPHLSDYGWVGEGRFGEHENEHCAIFYNKRELEIAGHGQFWLSETPDVIASKSWDSWFPRICTWARFARRDTGAVFYVYNTHFDHHSQAARDESSRVILERIHRERKQKDVPVILMGDFNSAPGDFPIRLLRGDAGTSDEADTGLIDAYSIMAGDPGLTAHSFGGGEEGEPIDYIFATPEFRFTDVLIDRREIEGGFPSDHYPVVAKLTMI
ncbi:endonuclease/exonuclease/phosphatase family protein [Paenibacillus sp. sptzw28]|uniref:endonuclease/exonuclease/phosphatase family protein n=1 Tax=Paenibacillus sp. sptzw28 TaxID=715179 RepID=UPI001C6E9E28|nr:endonuclease/exonuclease/phosphatase family protein [Paenibacillus sp. sptzw28]QYR21428.1 endonuclease/exonuclease/phosphatase family protein [Paenibacillus sp. sptzw28]